MQNALPYGRFELILSKIFTLNSWFIFENIMRTCFVLRTHMTKVKRSAIIGFFIGCLSLYFVGCTAPNIEPSIHQSPQVVIVKNDIKNDTGRQSSLLEIDLTNSTRTEIYQFQKGQLFLSISPNNQYLLFWEKAFLKLINLESKQIVESLYMGTPTSQDFDIVEHPKMVLWAPNGQKFAFLTDYPSSTTDIILYDVEKKLTTNLTNDRNIESFFTWSADGEEIAFAAVQACPENRIEDCPLAEQYWDIWSINLQTLEKTKWTDFSTTLIPDGGWLTNSLCNLVWSPNSEAIAFHSYCPTMSIPTVAELFVVYRGQKQQQITSFSHIDYANDYTYAWSADGHILYAVYSHDFFFDDENDERGMWGIFYDQPPISMDFKDLPLRNLNIVWSHRNFFLGKTYKSESESEGVVFQLENTELIPYIRNIPSYQQGIWLNGLFVIISENKLYTVDVSTKQIKPISLEFEGTIEIIE